MEPADLRTRDYLAERGGLNFTAIRGVAVQRPMGSRRVVVGGVAAKYPQEVSFVEHDDVVEALPTNGADQALAIGVLLWRCRCGQRFLDPHQPHSPDDLAGEDLVRVVKQAWRLGVVPERLDGLSCCPVSAG
jgi:hypothetical protein